jgi:ATP-dependent Lhr-like helicase
MDDVLAAFHPAVAGWFRQRFAVPTPVQARAWPAICERRNVLLAAPTGSGKTLAAFLAAIDELVREGTTHGLPDETRVLYVSPLKALSNDIQKNLEEPLAGIRAGLTVFDNFEIRSAVRTGDTPAIERARMRRLPPHILVTTPESLFILLTSESGRRMLATVRSVIVDELHAVADTKRGAHLALSLERLAGLCPRPPVRIGISATQKPIERMAEFLLGTGNRGQTAIPASRLEDPALVPKPQSDPDSGAGAGFHAGFSCEIIDTGYTRERDLALELPPSPLQPVMAGEVWAEIYDRLAELATAHRSTLLFVNTRRLAERAARHLAERLGEDVVTAHHGSLAREHRLDAENRLKAGQLKVLVATASLELGIDIGDVDLVCQVGSPRAIATLLQRVGRSGHGVGRLPKGRLFPLSRDDLVECAALLDAVRREELDAIALQGPALDVLAQQIVAEVAMGERGSDELYDLVRRARPYRDLPRTSFDAVLAMVAEGFTTARGRRAAHLHYDVVNGRLRPRPGARLTAITNGGTIPDQFDYDVVLQPEGFSIGSLNEDFAFESLPGDIFQLGNTSYRILKVETGKVFVEDARGQPPNIPFWFGEAPGRSDELSAAVSRLREQVDADLADGEAAARARLESVPGLTPLAAAQIVEYLGAARAALGVLPSHRAIVLERFFDEVGDTHLVIHSPFGSRLNRAWGLALRKRFCRKFNFELQAAALEDSIVLSLGPTHSFPLEDIASYLRAESVRDVLVQALLAAPMFPTRWRWVATTALAIRRNRNGSKVPPQFQRSDSDDLLALVFPDQVACAENLGGDRTVPDHPLVEQALHDCLHELMDVEGLERLLARIAAGEAQVIARDLTTPSPLAQEIITAKPYAFLDDAPAEERRTQAIRTRHLLDPELAGSIGRLDPEAIRRVCEEAWPDARNADELHDALALSGFITASEALDRGAADWTAGLAALSAGQRATVLTTPGGKELWVCAERLGQVLAVLPGSRCEPAIAPVSLRPAGNVEPGASDALRELARSRLETLGPVTAAELAAPLDVPVADLDAALIALEVEGQAMRGRFREHATDTEWCDRRLLARIHRYTLKTLRQAVEPVSPAACMRFLLAWHGVGEHQGEGPDALRGALGRLLGYPAPAAAWEQGLLPQRVRDYSRQYLDQLLAGGEFTWLRPASDLPAGARRAGPIRTTPLMFIDREHLDAWQALAGGADDAEATLSGPARQVRDALAERGAMFFADLVRCTGLLRTQAEAALGELVARGCVTSDGFAGVRALITPAARRASFSRPLERQRHGRRAISVDTAGRWDLLTRDNRGQTGISASTQGIPPPAPKSQSDPDCRDSSLQVEMVARVLLDRYGVVFRALLQREAKFLPPWRLLARQFRLMEARGEVRGGRFVTGFSGEQFAWPGVIEQLRAARHAGNASAEIVISAADPLNLTGILTPGERVPALARNRVLYRNGIPLAAFHGGEFRWLGAADAAGEWSARNALLRADPRTTYVPGPARPS